MYILTYVLGLPINNAVYLILLKIKITRLLLSSKIYSPSFSKMLCPNLIDLQMPSSKIPLHVKKNPPLLLSTCLQCPAIMLEEASFPIIMMEEHFRLKP